MSMNNSRRQRRK